MHGLRSTFCTLTKKINSPPNLLVRMVVICSSVLLIWAGIHHYNSIDYYVAVAKGSFDESNSAIQKLNSNSDSFSNITVNFEGFNNVTGADYFVIPNIVHFIRFNKSEFSFGEFICLHAAYRYQRPNQIYIHTNVEGGFSGKYWSFIEKDPELRATIKILPIEMPTEIFGKKLNPGWVKFHGSDIARLRILIKYGGIYLDNDSYIIRNLDKYRRFEMVVEWKVELDFIVANNIIMAHKDARFLQLWLDNYHDYHENKWYYNAGGPPVQAILEKRPELIHRVPFKLCAGNPAGFYSQTLYNVDDFDFRRCDTFHLSYNHRRTLDFTYNVTGELDELKIQNSTKPFCRMAAELINNLPFRPF